ncbi:MAG: hypothetical protein AAFN70_17335 [Planctomycetota bacterium]
MHSNLTPSEANESSLADAAGWEIRPPFVFVVTERVVKNCGAHAELQRVVVH